MPRRPLVATGEDAFCIGERSADTCLTPFDLVGGYSGL